MLRRVGQSLTLLSFCLFATGLACSSDQGEGNNTGGRGGTGLTGVAGASGGVPAGGSTGVGGSGSGAHGGTANGGQGGSVPEGAAHVHFVLKEVH
jgi:hypothetical protein